MKILSAKIESYSAFKEAEMVFNGLSVIVGKNGAGKSSLIEGLVRFFSEFAPTGGGVPLGFSDYFWFKRDTNKPITFTIKLELDEEEYKTAFTFPPEILTALNKHQKGAERTIIISRKVESPQSGWYTEYLGLGGVALVKDDRIVGQDELSQVLLSEEITSNYEFYLFDIDASQQNIKGNRLLFDIRKKAAFYSSPQIDSLVSQGLIKISDSGKGQDFREWCREHDVTLIARPPGQQELDFPIQPISQQLLQGILTQLTDVVRRKFKYIPAARDNPPLVAQRTSIVQTHIIDMYRNLFNSVNRNDEHRRDKLNDWLQKFTPKAITPNPSQILMKDSGLYLPLQFLGGGEQELLFLLWNLQEPACIYAIEEPENHFHPQYCRIFLNFLKGDLCKESQAIVSTHSPLIVDKTELGNNWLVTRKKDGSSVSQINDKGQLRLILAELGMVPSDIFLKDYALLLEGGTEKESVIPIFAEKLGYPNFTSDVMVTSVGGKNQFRNYMRIFLELIEHVPITYRILMDGSSSDEYIYLTKKLSIPAENITLLTNGSIEDYYPLDLVKQSLEELFQITDTILDPSKPIDHQIKKKLSDADKLTNKWKVRLGESVASKMTVEQIPKEIIEIITEIAGEVDVVS